MAKASSSKRPTSRKIPAEQSPVSDDYTDEEVDADDYLPDEEEENAGVAVWAPDEWDGEDGSANETGDDSKMDSESDGDADDNPDLVRLPCLSTPASSRTSPCKTDLADPPTTRPPEHAAVHTDESAKVTPGTAERFRRLG